jgi:hypothetical protein
MTAQSQAARYDLQTGLLAPGAMPTRDEYAALLNLAREAELNVRRTGDTVLHGAVVEVRESQR